MEKEKYETYKVKLSPTGEIKIPKPVLLSAGLKGEVILKTRNHEVLIKSIDSKIKSTKDPVEKISGSINLSDPKIIDEIVESDDWL